MIGQRRLYSGGVREIMTREGNDPHGPSFRIGGTQDIRNHPLACIVRRNFLICLALTRKLRNLRSGFQGHERRLDELVVSSDRGWTMLLDGAIATGIVTFGVGAGGFGKFMRHGEGYFRRENMMIDHVEKVGKKSLFSCDYV